MSVTWLHGCYLQSNNSNSDSVFLDFVNGVMKFFVNRNNVLSRREFSSPRKNHLILLLLVGLLGPDERKSIWYWIFYGMSHNKLALLISWRFVSFAKALLDNHNIRRIPDCRINKVLLVHLHNPSPSWAVKVSPWQWLILKNSFRFSQTL